MPKNDTIDDLRAELFATLRDLRAKDEPLAIDRANAVVNVAHAIIGSAKAQVDFMRAAQSIEGKSFFAGNADGDDKPALPQAPGARSVITHRIK